MYIPLNKISSAVLKDIHRIHEQIHLIGIYSFIISWRDVFKKVYYNVRIYFLSTE